MNCNTIIVITLHRLTKLKVHSYSLIRKGGRTANLSRTCNPVQCTCKSWNVHTKSIKWYIRNPTV